LGIFFFVVKYNAASLRPHIPRLTLKTACKQKRIKCKTEGCTKHAKDLHALYIDDLSEAEAIELKNRLIVDPVQRPYPLNYHERTKHILPTNSILQQNLVKIENFTVNNLMRINERKSKVMIFNKSRKYDFPPELSFKNGEILECLEEAKLLGILLNSSLKWNSNTAAMYSKAMSKMWLIRRMKMLKLEPDIIFDYYSKEIRPLVEQGVVVWNSGLTKAQVKDLEKIQKIAFLIILGEEYSSYDVACQNFNVDTLSSRRTTLCTNFAVKLYKSQRSDQFFNPPDNTLNTRNEKQLVKENICRTTRCYNAPHNYLARLVNKNVTKIEKTHKL
jgi:hypothetical protein